MRGTRWERALTPLLAVAAAAPVPAQPTASGTAVRAALLDRDYRAAGMAFNALVAQRLPTTDKAGNDPLLDRLYAELAASGEPAAAVSLLRRVMATVPVDQRAHYQLLLATALEDGGAFGESERLYEAVGGDAAATPDDRVSALIGYVRLHMLTDPAAAEAILATIRPGSSQAWEVELERARLASLTGHDDIAAAALQAAWNAAAAAGPGEAAPARVAADMLVAAGRAGDRARTVALLSLDRLNRDINTGQSELAASLPICGRDGVGPDDRVAVAFLRQAPPGRPRFALIWASRAAVAAPFLRAVARSGGLQVSDGHAAPVMLECRGAPSEDFRGTFNLNDQVLDWSTSRGAYPLIDTDDDADTASLATALAERERRYGPTSAMLIPVLVRILDPAVSNASDTEALKRAAALARRIASIVAANKAPADVVLLTDLYALGLEVGAQVKPPGTAQAEFGQLLAAAAANPAVSPDALFAVVVGAAGASQVPTALRAALLERAIAVLRDRGLADDPRMAALGLRLIEVRRDQGDDAAVAEAIHRFGFATDLCAVADPAVRFVSSNILPEDYPPDLVQTLLQGRTVLEFAIEASGTASRTRLLVSDPPFAFDDVALAKSTTLTYDPAKTNGAPRSCRGAVQAIRWQLPG